MKASVLHQFGGPEVLSYEEVKTPEPGKGEVLIRVEACSINRIDSWFRSGRYKTSLPRILGADIAGYVEKVGEGVVGFSKGEKVVVYTVLSDGTCYYCMRGKRNRCVNVGFVGGVIDGGYAEYVKIPSYNLLKYENLSPELTSCLPVDFGTALNSLRSIGRIDPEDFALVLGASGGLGHAYVQLLKLLGLTVIAASSDERKIEFLKSLGADYAVNYKTEDLVSKVMEITGSLGVGIVVDHSGRETWNTSLALLRKGGIMITAGITTGDETTVNIPKVYRNELKIQGVYSYNKEDLLTAISLASKGKIKPYVFKVFKLQDAAWAHRILESGEFLGKLVLKPSE